MGFLAPIASAVGGFLGFSGTAATVAGTAAMGLGVASAVNKDVRRVALPALGGMALGGLLAPAEGALSGSASLGGFGSVSKSALLGGAVGGYTGMKMNEAAKMRQMQEDYYNNQKAFMSTLLKTLNAILKPLSAFHKVPYIVFKVFTHIGMV